MFSSSRELAVSNCTPTHRRQPSVKANVTTFDVANLGKLRDAHASASQRHVNREDTATAWHIPDGDVPSMRSHSLPSYRETEPEPRAISPASVAERLEQVRLAFGNASALI